MLEKPARFGNEKQSNSPNDEETDEEMENEEETEDPAELDVSKAHERAINSYKILSHHLPTSSLSAVTNDA